MKTGTDFDQKLKGVNFNYPEKLILAGFFLLLWLYLWLRAAFVPLVNDEIGTFFYFVQGGKFIPYLSDWDANNHLLNSALTFISYKLFGLSELSLRLPNLLFALALFYALFRFAGEIPNIFTRWMFILSICLNHFFIEYCALSRGYGMSMSLILLSVWLCYRAIKTNRNKYYLLCLISLALSLTANLTLIYSTLIIIFLLILNVFLNKSQPAKEKAIKYIIIFVLGVIPVILSVKYLFELKVKNMLFYGMPGNFWEVTVKSLVFHSMGSENSISLVYTVLIFLIIMAGGLLVMIKKDIRNTFSQLSCIFIILLFGNLIALFAANLLLGVKFPEDRVGLFLIPFFTGSFYFLNEDVIIIKKRLVKPFLSLPMLVLPVYFIINVNLTHTLYWKEISLPGRFYEKICSDAEAMNELPIVGARMGLSNIWAMHNYRNGGLLNLLHATDTTEIQDDYVIYPADANKRWYGLYDSLDFDPFSGYTLMRRKYPPHKELLKSTSQLHTNGITNETFFGFLEGTLDTLAGKDILFTWKMAFHSVSAPFKGYVVIDFRNRENNSIYYSKYEMEKIKKCWTGEYGNFTGAIKFNNIPADAVKFKLYLWNFYNSSCAVNDGSANVFRVK
jgi:hypothetical protein